MRPNDFDEAVKGLSREFRRTHDGLRSQQDHVVLLLRIEERLRRDLAEKGDLLTEATGLLIEAMEENSGTNEHVLGPFWQQRASQLLQKVRGWE